MERAFTEDVKKLNGEIKYPAGAVRDFSHDTWNGIARSLQRPLDDFTEMTNKEVQMRTPTSARKARSAPAAAPPKGKVARRTVVKES